VGVAIADKPEGPFVPEPEPIKGINGIDPCVLQASDGNAYIFWGNGRCAKLKENMIEIDGEITKLEFDQRWPFTEAAWVHKANGKYYLTYACGWPEKLAYAMSDSINGPWEFKGLLSECAGNCNTTHPSIVELNGKTYMFTHNGTLPEGTSYSRSVTVEEIKYNPDGTMQKCDVTTKGINGKGW
jgi:beta-xylosidase